MFKLTIYSSIFIEKSGKIYWNTFKLSIGIITDRLFYPIIILTHTFYYYYINEAIQKKM